MDTERAESLFTQLWDHLKAQNMRSLDIQTRNAEEAVRSLEAASSKEEKEEIIRDYYRILYPGGRGGLSDAVLWDPDYQVRQSLNEPIERIGKELGEIIRTGTEPCAASEGPFAESSPDRRPDIKRHADPDRAKGTGGDTGPSESSSFKNSSGRSGQTGPADGKRKLVLRFGMTALCGTLALLIMTLFFGSSGKHVLVWAALQGAAAMALGTLLFSILFTVRKSEKTASVILITLAGLILTAYGALSEVHVIKDLGQGTKEALIYDCQVLSRTGAHGILGLRHYLSGRDRQGNEMRFPLSVLDLDSCRDLQTAEVIYYPYTGRMTAWREAEEISPDNEISFGDLERSMSEGKVDDISQVRKILLEWSEGGLLKAAAVDLDKKEVYLDQDPERIYRKKPDLYLDEEGAAAVRKVLDSYGVLDWDGFARDLEGEDGDSWLLVIQGTGGVIRCGGRGTSWDRMAPEGFRDFTRDIMTLVNTETGR